MCLVFILNQTCAHTPVSGSADTSGVQLTMTGVQSSPCCLLVHEINAYSNNSGDLSDDATVYWEERILESCPLFFSVLQMCDGVDVFFFLLAVSSDRLVLLPHTKSTLPCSVLPG